MRILQSCLSQAWGGLEMVAYETAVRLHDEGVPVLNVVWPGSPLAKKLSARGLRTLELAPGHKYLSPDTILRLRAALSSEGITTVIVQQLRDLWFMVPALVGHPNTRAIGVAHMWIDAHKRGPVYQWLYGRLYRLVALTEAHKQNLKEHLPTKENQFTILPNTVDARRFSPEKRDLKVREQLAASDKMLVGVVSRLDPKKGLLDVVAAADLLRQAGTPFQIAIVGSETFGEENFKTILQNEIDRRGLSAHVRLVGHRPDIEAVMASIDVLLMPSPAETFGRVIIEAMASGVPVVASSGGGVKDIIEHRDTGLLVSPGDTKAMADALKLLCDDPGFRQQVARKGLERARTVYDPATVNREFDRLLK